MARDYDDRATLHHPCARGRVVEVADQNIALMGEVRKCHTCPKKNGPDDGARLTPGLAWNRRSGPLSLCFKRQTQAGFRRKQRKCATSSPVALLGFLEDYAPNSTPPDASDQRTGAASRYQGAGGASLKASRFQYVGMGASAGAGSCRAAASSCSSAAGRASRTARNIAVVSRGSFAISAANEVIRADGPVRRAMRQW